MPSMALSHLRWEGERVASYSVFWDFEPSSKTQTYSTILQPPLCLPGGKEGPKANNYPSKRFFFFFYVFAFGNHRDTEVLLRLRGLLGPRDSHAPGPRADGGLVWLGGVPWSWGGGVAKFFFFGGFYIVLIVFLSGFLGFFWFFLGAFWEFHRVGWLFGVLLWFSSVGDIAWSNRSDGVD